MAYSTYGSVQRKTANRRVQDTYVVGNTTEDKYLEFYGIPKRKKQYYVVRAIRRVEI